MPSAKPRRSPKPQERQRDPERTRKLILDAASSEFAAHGYAGARTGAIAAKAGVNQQLLWYYFGSKEGLYQALTQQWQTRESQLVSSGTPLSEQIRRYALEATNNPDAVRLLAWGGLEYTGPSSDFDQERRAQHMQSAVDEIRARQNSGQLSADIDPACLTIILTAAAMATTSIPNVIEGICRVDPHSSEFVHHYAEQVALVARLLGLDPPEPD
ncbi:TetR/AcrR family transcriptional regulator [Nocardia sp. NPDC127579]|uniref:TetR/AcrR family transcriptional regulator n=1 Tax=Nocardia sp. NPDC127579 TaxID=3345402 RepID=UPI003626FC3C